MIYNAKVVIIPVICKLNGGFNITLTYPYSTLKSTYCKKKKPPRFTTQQLNTLCKLITDIWIKHSDYFCSSLSISFAYISILP